MPLVTVEVDLDEIDVDELAAACRERGLYVSHPGESDPLVERAFLAARELPKVPQALKDLFYQVHGRAMP